MEGLSGGVLQWRSRGVVLCWIGRLVVWRSGGVYCSHVQ